MRRAFLILTWGAALSACNMAPTYVRPTPPVPAGFPGGPAYAPAAATEKPGLPWTALIGDPSLRTVIGRALDNNRDLRAALANVEAARALYRVQRAENAEAALKLMESGAKFDLLFTDVVMPGAISTRDLAKQAQAMHRGIRILYTSGYTQNAIIHNGRLDDDAFLLSKPYRKDELARKLRSVFAGTARGPLQAEPPPIAPHAERRGKILVVEDIMLIRMATVDMVEQIGFQAAEAGDGAEALAILQRDPEIEILLTDLGLPGMNGRQLVEEARRLRPDLKVIIASGYSTENAAGGRPKDESIKHLTKPFDLGQLRRALEV